MLAIKILLLKMFKKTLINLIETKLLPTLTDYKPEDIQNIKTKINDFVNKI